VLLGTGKVDESMFDERPLGEDDETEPETAPQAPQLQKHTDISGVHALVLQSLQSETIKSCAAGLMGVGGFGCRYEHPVGKPKGTTDQCYELNDGNRRAMLAIGQNSNNAARGYESVLGDLFEDKGFGPHFVSINRIVSNKCASRPDGPSGGYELLRTIAPLYCRHGCPVILVTLIKADEWRKQKYVCC
jgi:hypothetical protein